ncbi:10872_t:CDS:2 [Racocetra persica]|uniref:10872_t:CDS:1 n=1 Tax=Racocetra persica TaxID=160502 RepID=A0ACA9KTY3_9GLOM|nr:10872_t:CDS:2 [Racocetra persica]
MVVNTINLRLKTAAQYLQNNDILEQAIIQLIEHKSIQGICAYKQVNEDQQLIL